MSDEQTMVERVARAIETAGFEWKAANGGDNASFADVPEEVFARAAIKAMREPNEAMYKGGCKAIGAPFLGRYRAMINAALAEQPELT